MLLFFLLGFYFSLLGLLESMANFWTSDNQRVAIHVEFPRVLLFPAVRPALLGSAEEGISASPRGQSQTAGGGLRALPVGHLLCVWGVREGVSVPAMVSVEGVSHSFLVLLGRRWWGLR